MGQELLDRVRGAVEKQGLVRAGERVGVAVSGGADSVGLLLLLMELRKQLGVVLSVAHFNHKLRGRHSEADEKFVAKLAEKCGLAFHAGRADIAARAKSKRANLEDTARRARYEFFAHLVEDGRVDKVAVAHTADDQAETVLAHILRGTGIAGLGGIHPQVGKVVRPLLSIRRAELRSFLKRRKQTWREDASNRDTTKTRARIRKRLLPLLQKQFQPRVVEHLAALSSHAREDDALLNRLAAERLESRLKIVPEGARIAVSDLLGNEGVFTGLSSRLVRRIIHKQKFAQPSASPHGTGELTALHVAQVLDIARHGKTGAALQLPGGMEVRRHADALLFCAVSKKKDAPARDEQAYEHEIDFLLDTTVVQVPELQCAFRFTVIDWLWQRGGTCDS